MKKTIIATTIAALLASSAVPAIAQDAAVGVGVDAGAGVSAETPALDAEAGAGVDASANAAANASDMADNNYGSVVAALKSNADFDFTAVTEDTEITIVLLSSLKGEAENNAAALDNELAANADAQADLSASISENAAIMAKLEAEGYAAEDVVTLKTKADGSVIVYVDDRA